MAKSEDDEIPGQSFQCSSPTPKVSKAVITIIARIPRNESYALTSDSCPGIAVQMRKQN